ncbi:glycerol-3-phosphate 1-O-acyltransferase PlsY [Polynucleobacter sp. MWH-UH24A]|uniref:glycerol-3-phosphate 1-O-acyltransferase PlsY n=1 Tax=Polynucleobacter sp. MWH-UH24A TaxID=2689110 RepID=UPI001BFD30AC|nr:glycerol-3-phosphate 1-O-acyltransferase PlsY [Polynucleobacter sp. MWH-UH24A]QWD76377.1 glycerol-3-phosphate 1-O-acyltransferase PlsY [Polynucleobacter sp. MWH-UH24A]
MEPIIIIVFLLIVIAYFLGSISFAVIVSKMMGLPDPYTHGSKNPGATNVLRTGNKVAAALTLIGDAAKGWLAVTLAREVLGGPSQESVNILLGLVAIAVFIGHLYPIFHRFKGGKGVATAAGILFAINWVLGLATLGTWLIVAVFMRYSSLAALCAAVFAPIYFTFLFGAQPMGLAIVAMSALLIYRHRSNIRNLLNGTETRLSKK